MNNYSTIINAISIIILAITLGKSMHRIKSLELKVMELEITLSQK